MWIVPKLWSYAATNQPNGDFSQYSSEELAVIIGCPKYATSIRQALLDAGFMDTCGILHDWNEHNGYHASYANRARRAAKARWGFAESPSTPPSEDKDKDKDKETSIACSMLVASTLEDKPNSKAPTDGPADVYGAPSALGFAAFWEAYPRKVGKQDALRAWKKSKTRPDVSIVLEAVVKQRASEDWQKEKGRFIPNPATWINGGRWDDQPTMLDNADSQKSQLQQEQLRKALS